MSSWFHRALGLMAHKALRALAGSTVTCRGARPRLVFRSDEAPPRSLPPRYSASRAQCGVSRPLAKALSHVRILVTGATGFIGGRLVERLRSRQEVYAMCRQPRTAAAGVHWIVQDLRQPLDASALPTHIDSVFHLVQSRRFREFPAQADDIFDVNVQGTLRVLEYARRAGAARFVLTSSGGIYGFSNRAFTEADPIQPPDFYLESKYAAESLATHYRDYFRTTTLRLFFAYGAGQMPTMLIPRLVRLVLRGQPITLYGSDGVHINPVYVDDVVDALERTLELDGHHVVNVGGPEVLSLGTIARVIGQHVNRGPLFTTPAERGPGDIVGDLSSMRSVLGAPRVRFVDGVGEVCREWDTKLAVDDDPL